VNLEDSSASSISGETASSTVVGSSCHSPSAAGVGLGGAVTCNGGRFGSLLENLSGALMWLWEKKGRVKGLVKEAGVGAERRNAIVGLTYMEARLYLQKAFAFGL